MRAARELLSTLERHESATHDSETEESAQFDAHAEVVARDEERMLPEEYLRKTPPQEGTNEKVEWNLGDGTDIPFPPWDSLDTSMTDTCRSSIDFSDKGGNSSDNSQAQDQTLYSELQQSISEPGTRGMFQAPRPLSASVMRW